MLTLSGKLVLSEHSIQISVLKIIDLTPTP